jgi:hypothetical protein
LGGGGQAPLAMAAAGATRNAGSQTAAPSMADVRRKVRRDGSWGVRGVSMGNGWPVEGGRKGREGEAGT